MKNLWFIMVLLSMFVVDSFATSGGSNSAGATIQTQKNQYLVGEEIVVSFSNMLGDSEDWIAIYSSGASNDWDNVVSWIWSGGKVHGSVKLEGVNVQGEYQARAFFKNSFNTSAEYAFSVIEAIEAPSVVLLTNHTSYKSNQKIIVKFSNMSGKKDDWIGIYPAGKNSNWDNLVDSKWITKKSGKVTFNFLPAGSYEVRAFFDGNYDEEGKKAFHVVSDNNGGGNNDFTMYEDVKNGISSKWETISGPFAPKAINGAIKLTTNWETNTHNSSHYQLPMNNSKQTILELDMGGVGAAGGHIGGIHAYAPAGYMAHFGVGVIVETTNGIRGMTWDSFLNHEDVDAYKNDYGDGNIELIYPSPIEHVRGFGYTDINLWEHFKVDLNAYLAELEPGNKIIKVKTFYAKGGYLDNIKLSSK